MLIRPAIAFATSLAATTLTPTSLASPSHPPQFGPPQPLTSPTTFALSIVAADVTMDGWPDVITTSSTTDSVVLFPSTGPGSFGPSKIAIQLPSSELLHIEGVELADFNGDGTMDLVIHSNEWSPLGTDEILSVALATGRGEWTDPLVQVQLRGHSMNSVAADYDGDQFQDLLYSVIAAGGNQEIWLRRGRGDGTFAPPVLLSDEVGHQSGLRLAADFDGDGDLDLLDSPNYNTLGYRRNDGAAGLAPRVVLQDFGFSITGPVVADFDGDGDLDIAQPNSFLDVISVFLNDGAGNFSVDAPLFGAGEPAKALVAMDVDLDGHVDLVAAQDERDVIVLHRNLGGGTFAAPAVLAAGRGARAALLLATDIDLDGRDDLLAGAYFFDDGPSASRIVLHRNSGSGSSLEDPVSITSSAFGAVRLTARDMDGDGDEELLFLPETTGAVAMMENLGFAERGGFGHAQEVEATFAYNDALAVGDLDGDGDQDLVTRSGTEDFREAFFVVENLGPMGFGQPSMLSNIQSHQMALGDFDDDGDLDVALCSFLGELTVCQNVGSLQFVPGISIDLPGDRGGRLIPGDLTGDGVDDLVSLTTSFPQAESTVSVLPGTPSGLGAPTILFQELSVLHDASIADLSGDGLPDLVVAGEDADGLSLITGRPNGGFDPAVPLAPGTRYSVVAADIDLDGLVDIVTSTFFLGTLWQRNLGAASFAAPVLLHRASQFTLIDVEPDGDLDLAVSDFIPGEIWMLENTTRDRVGASICGPAVPNSSGASGQIEALGSELVGDDTLRLRARSLPNDVPGYFLAARSTAVTFPVTGSEGRLCLAGPIGRFVGSGEVQDSGPSGWFNLAVAPTALPTPGGFIAATTGETWYFQAWHRDVSAQGGTTNFTDALAVTWQ